MANLTTGTNLNFVYDNKVEISDVTTNTDNYKTGYAPGSIIFQNVSGTATTYENDGNTYKGLYIVDKLENSATTIEQIFSNRLTNYQCSTKTGADLEINNNDSIQEAIGKLHKAIIDLEYVMAAALNDLNSRLNLISTAATTQSNQGSNNGASQA